MTHPPRLTTALAHVLTALMPADTPAAPACAKDIAYQAVHPINTVTGILTRLETHGIITGQWLEAGNGRHTRPIRVYTLTPHGITYIRSQRTGTPHG